jgi:hypothetical protein
MSKPSTNPDWYRVKYGIAARWANWAFAKAEGRSTHLDEAAKEARELLRAISGRLNLDSWGLRARRPEVRALKAFLRTQIQPSARVLLAGIELEQAQSRIPAAERKDPRAVVRAVEAAGIPTPELSYTLACFWAQARKRRRALRHLQDAVDKTPFTGRKALCQQVEADPVLGFALDHADFQLLFADGTEGEGLAPSRFWT